MHTSNSPCLFPRLYALVKSLQRGTQPCCFPRKSISIFHIRLYIGLSPVYVSMLKGIALQPSVIDCYVSSFPMIVSHLPHPSCLLKNLSFVHHFQYKALLTSSFNLLEKVLLLHFFKLILSCPSSC